MRIEKLKISPFTLPGSVKNNHPSSFKGNKALTERLLKTRKDNEVIVICKSNNLEIGEYEFFLVFFEKRELRESLQFLKTLHGNKEKDLKKAIAFLLETDNLIPLSLFFNNKNVNFRS